ncbi:MAG: hypothetical protein K6E38_07545 [Fretibacterium sp.]|nr:hypothetical protein [Fretibacterium sp.]
MKKLLLIIVIVLAAAFGYTWYLDHSGDVDQAYVKAHLGKTGVVVVDVRSEEVYNGKAPREGIPGGRISGAINFPLAGLEKAGAAEALTKAGITKDVEVILYCNTGNQSGKFAKALVTKFGFDRAKVKNFKGGVVEWTKNPANPFDAGEQKPQAQ